MFFRRSQVRVGDESSRFGLKRGSSGNTDQAPYNIDGCGVFPQRALKRMVVTRGTLDR